MDQERWSELTVARRIWDQEHRAAAKSAQLTHDMLDPNVGQVG